jgi:hypothetical protein
MSLPTFSAQQPLFGVGSLADNLFAPTNRFRLFGEKVWPLLVRAHPALETMYCAENGRPAAEPVVLAGLCLLQFLERVPDRAAMECLAMHLGWKRALHRKLDAGAYDPSLLTYFRERLLKHEQAQLLFDDDSMHERKATAPTCRLKKIHAEIEPEIMQTEELLIQMRPTVSAQLVAHAEL